MSEIADKPETVEAHPIPSLEIATQEGVLFLLLRAEKLMHPKSIELPHLRDLIAKFPKELGDAFRAKVAPPVPLETTVVIRHNMAPDAIDAIAQRIMELMDERAAANQPKLQ